MPMIYNRFVATLILSLPLVWGCVAVHTQSTLQVPIIQTHSHIYKTYITQKGDTLWRISSIEYEDPYLWPLIYQDNLDKILDPNYIDPGVPLKIDLEPTPRQIASASQLASEYPPNPLKETYEN